MQKICMNIVDKLSFKVEDPQIKIQELINHLNQYKNDIKAFSRVIYIEGGRTKLYTEKTFNQILGSSKKIPNPNDNKEKDKDSESRSSIMEDGKRKNSERKHSNLFNQNLKGSFINTSDEELPNSVKEFKKVGFYLNKDTSKSQSQISKKNYLIRRSTFPYINSNKKIYIINNKFTRDLIRKYFSSYFNRILTYDEDFINIKHLYTLTYHNEIDNIDKYGLCYPTRLKHYITNNYNKIFLKRDFDFFTDGYFQYSHQYLYNRKFNYNYIFQNKFIFPEKKLVLDSDGANFDIQSILNELTIYECEMLTVKGAIFGNIFVFDNCLLFKSELKNDKRTKNSKLKNAFDSDYLDYACCSIDYEHLMEEKKIAFEFSDIKEVVNRTFFYSWISLEIFLKDGKSFLFNLFNEETNDDLLEFLKQKKITVIRKVSDFFKREDYIKKWKDEKISTFDYLLLLNKFSSRTFNDPNQYPLLPWLFLEKGKNFIRNFDLPISVQDEDKQIQHLSKKENYIIEEGIVTHGNHYSTSAYILFYLMRTNPFTNNMIKFQSNCFDIPDRQYNDIKQTIFLCQKMNNNREMIPELFSIPEIYINLNDNDFGKQKEGVRVHNISFEPYAENPIQFSYMIKDLINNNIEINNSINKWFDFIFGVNQLGSYCTSQVKISSQEKEKLKSLRRFNSYCYGKLNNVKKLYISAQKHNKSYKDLYNDIRMHVNIAINFGQCPYQLLTELHPYKNKKISVIIDDNFSGFHMTPGDSNNSGENNSFSRYNSAFNFKVNKTTSNYLNNMSKINDIYKLKSDGQIIYFSRSSNNNYLYCFLSDKSLEIYKYDSKKNIYNYIKTILPKTKFLFLKKTKNNNLIFTQKYLFCEINENALIYCRTLNKTLIYYNYIEDVEIPISLHSYTSSILYIKNNEFLTGHDNGKITKWKINISTRDKTPILELLQTLKSNKNSITCLTYDEKINIIAGCDNSTIMIRKYYDFEYLSCINIQNKENKNTFIVDVKINDYNFIYALIYIEEDDLYELQGFTLNGIYFGKYRGNISNFDITKTGKIIVGDKRKPIIKVLDPSSLECISEKSFDVKKDNLFYHFNFQIPNIIYYGIEDSESTRIKIMLLDSDNENTF